jgi:hypothetical protein
MTITLSLKPEVERSLLARAKERGLTLDDYLRELIEREAGGTAGARRSGKEKARAFVEWAKSHRHTEPLSDEAISRTTQYPDRA